MGINGAIVGPLIPKVANQGAYEEITAPWW